MTIDYHTHILQRSESALTQILPAVQVFGTVKEASEPAF